MFFALTLAGFIWVGVVAARRIRDWGDMGRMLEAGADGVPGGVPGGSGHHAEVRGRIRALVAERLDGQLRLPGAATHASPSGVGGGPGEEHDSAELLALRVGDVLMVELAEASMAGDFVVEGVVQLREGATERRVVAARDGSKAICVVLEPHRAAALVLDMIDGHGWSGEPARNLTWVGQSYSLERRGQSSAYGLGTHGRPTRSRVATYLLRAPDGGVLWLERWGHEIVAATGREIPLHGVRRLQGS